MAKILIVEDDANLRMLMTLRLKSKYDIVSCADGAAALEKYEEGGIDLIVTDLMMPAMDGYALVENIRSLGHNTPVIMLTAKDGINDKGRGFAVGTDDYMTKPVNFEELIWRIDALLRRSKIANEGKITIGEVVVDKQSFTVTRGDEVFELPTKEFQLLYLLPARSSPRRTFWTACGDTPPRATNTRCARTSTDCATSSNAFPNLK